MLKVVLVSALVVAGSCTADARPYKRHRYVAQPTQSFIVFGQERQTSTRPPDCYGIKWCGCWLRHQLGVASKEYNLARAWARYGAPAAGPAIGAIVVWAHHVGIITNKTAEGWVVKSGNDGHAVRERVRDLRRAIAFRYPTTGVLR